MNRFIRFIVDNSHFSILLVAIILFYGLSSLYQTQLTQDPNVYRPIIQVKLFLAGASPSELQKNVIFPIEAELRTIGDLTQIKTHIGYSHSVATIHFQYGVDVDQKIREVESKLNNIKRKLPAALDFQVSGTQISDTMSAFLIGVHSQVESRERQYGIALDVVNALEKIDRLKNISVIQPDEDIIVSLDLITMRRLGLSVEQVAAAIRADNAFSASGRLQVDDKYFRFNGPGTRYQRFEDILKTPVYTADGTPIALGKIVEVSKRAQGNRVISRYNGVDSFFIKVGVSPDVNILDIKNKIDAAIRQVRSDIPDTVQIDFLFAQSEGVRNIVFNLLNNLIQGFVILVAVLLFSVGLRSTIILSTILPLSFLTAIFLFSFSGYGIQQVSIGGFIIALGLIIDNGIVVTENAYILQQYHGYSKRDAAVSGTSAAVSPLLSSTLTTMLAFAPIFMLTTDVGLYLRSMSVSIWLSLFASLLIAVSFITLLLSRIGTLGPLWFIPNPPSFLILLIPFRDRVYKTMLYYAVRWRVITVAAFALLLGIALYAATRLHVEVFPPIGDPYFTINVTLPPDYHEQTLDQVARTIEAKLKRFDAVKDVVTLGGTRFPYLNVTIDYLGDLVLLVKTRFGDAAHLRKLLAEIKTELAPLKMYADISLSLFQYKDLSNRSPFTLVLSGSEAEALRSFAKRIDDEIRRVKGVDIVQNPMKSSQTALQLNFLEQRAELSGVTRSQADYFINMLTYGNEIARFRDSRGLEFPVRLKIDPDREDPLEVLREIMVPTLKGGTMPLSEVVEPVFQESESAILHVLFLPTVEIDFWQKAGFTPEEVSAAVVETVKGLGIPEGITVEIGGALHTKKKDFQTLGKNTLLTASLIFAIFVLQFRSFSQPFIVFSAVPLCIIGAIFGLLAAGQPMNFFAAVGITSLMGIVVNDSILLVDEGNKLLQEDNGMSLREIAVEAGRKRFMPVLLTSVTTIAGVLPLALGDSIFKAMAITIAGGLFSSTLLILFLVPALYSFLSSKQSRTKEDIHC